MFTNSIWWYIIWYIHTYKALCSFVNFKLSLEKLFILKKENGKIKEEMKTVSSFYSDE